MNRSRNQRVHAGIVIGIQFRHFQNDPPRTADQNGFLWANRTNDSISGSRQPARIAAFRCVGFSDDLGNIREEGCPIGLTPTSTIAVMLAISDAIAMVAKGITKRDYGLRHHGGYLGRVARTDNVDD